VRANRSIPSPTVVPVLIYPDVSAAVAWLQEAFGFVERVRIGAGHRSQLKVGDGAVIVADARNERRPPRSGEVTHSVLVRVDGKRQYAAEAPAGHQWTFSETLDDVAPETWGGTLVAS